MAHSLQTSRKTTKMESTTVRKATFAWASIAGADPEPVEVIEKEGRSGILTTGCADPFWLDDQSVGIVLYVNKLVRPPNPETAEQRDKRDAEYRKSRTQSHSWRGPR